MEKRMDIGQIASLIGSIISPKPGERMAFITDYPEGKRDLEGAGREELLLRWHKAACILSEKNGFRVFPIIKYRETGKNNSDLPKTAATVGGGHVSGLAEFLASVNIVIAITKYSATAPLKNIASAAENLRVVSMPGVTPEMEGAMSADYAKIDDRGRRLLAVVENAVGFEIIFDGAGVPKGTELFIDTRANNWILDSCMCHKRGDFINFPSGELFTPPYEGATEEGKRALGDSATQGVLPVYSPIDKKIAFLKIEKNRIARAQGDSLEAERIRADIGLDARNANIAELGLGLNEKARSGPEAPVLEREKSGPHIAYGRNDHFGKPGGLAGTVEASVHVDYVYSENSPIKATVFAVFENGKRALIAQRGRIVAV